MQPANLQLVNEVWTCPTCRAKTNSVECPNCGTTYHYSQRYARAHYVIARVIAYGVLGMFALAMLIGTLCQPK